MAQPYTIAMVVLHPGTPRDREAHEHLAAALPGADVAEPDDIGIFEINLEADDQEQALERASGTPWPRRAPMTTSSFSNTPSCPSAGSRAAGPRRPDGPAFTR